MRASLLAALVLATLLPQLKSKFRPVLPEEALEEESLTDLEEDAQKESRKIVEKESLQEFERRQLLENDEDRLTDLQEDLEIQPDVNEKDSYGIQDKLDISELNVDESAAEQEKLSYKQGNEETAETLAEKAGAIIEEDLDEVRKSVIIEDEESLDSAKLHKEAEKNIEASKDVSTTNEESNASVSNQESTDVVQENSRRLRYDEENTDEDQEDECENVESKSMLPETYSLKGVRSIVSPDLLYALASAGWQDQLVITDSTFPLDEIQTSEKKIIRLEGVSLQMVVDEIMKLWKLCDENPLDAMLSNENPEEPEVTNEIVEAIAIITEKEEACGSKTTDKNMNLLKREQFLYRAKTAKYIVKTGEKGPWNNIILRKGIITGDCGNSCNTRQQIEMKDVTETNVHGEYAPEINIVTKKSKSSKSSSKYAEDKEAVKTHKNTFEKIKYKHEVSNDGNSHNRLSLSRDKGENTEESNSKSKRNKSSSTSEDYTLKQKINSKDKEYKEEDIGKESETSENRNEEEIYNKQTEMLEAKTKEGITEDNLLISNKKGQDNIELDYNAEQEQAKLSKKKKLVEYADELDESTDTLNQKTRFSTGLDEEYEIDMVGGAPKGYRKAVDLELNGTISNGDEEDESEILMNVNAFKKKSNSDTEQIVRSKNGEYLQENLNIDDGLQDRSLDNERDIYMLEMRKLNPEEDEDLRLENPYAKGQNELGSLPRDY